MIEKGGAFQCKKYLNEEILEIFAKMKPHGQARGPKKHTHLRRGFGGSSAAVRNPPKHSRFIVAIVNSRVTHSSTAKAVVSCVGG